MSAAFRCEPLSRAHRRAAFSCGNEALDRYLQERALQDEKRRVARSYALVDVTTDLMAGYYTIAAASIDLTALPADVVRRLPRYPVVPAIMLGRLARDLRFRGRGVGELLLADAVQLSSGG
jgi:hypothetical protein